MQQNPSQRVIVGGRKDRSVRVERPLDRSSAQRRVGRLAVAGAGADSTSGRKRWGEAKRRKRRSEGEGRGPRAGCRAWSVPGWASSRFEGSPRTTQTESHSCQSHGEEKEHDALRETNRAVGKEAVAAAALAVLSWPRALNLVVVASLADRYRSTERERSPESFLSVRRKE